MKFPIPLLLGMAYGRVGCGLFALGLALRWLAILCLGFLGLGPVRWPARSRAVLQLHEPDQAPAPFIY